MLSRKHFAEKCTRTDLSCSWQGNSIPMTMLARTSRVLQPKKLHDYGWEVLPHAPYSPDMSQPDFDIFPKLKEPIRERRFSSLEELSTDDTRAIRDYSEGL